MIEKFLKFFMLLSECLIFQSDLFYSIIIIIIIIEGKKSIENWIDRFKDVIPLASRFSKPFILEGLPLFYNLTISTLIKMFLIKLKEHQ